jgi:hypothetical protein
LEIKTGGLIIPGLQSCFRIENLSWKSQRGEANDIFGETPGSSHIEIEAK